jgi:AcrR family transcriptional regulator
MGRREENKARTRQELIDTGLRQFRERGFEATRVQDIVEAVGVSQATFFNYFPTKQAILEAQAAYTQDLYDALLRHELERTSATVAQRLDQITRVLATYLESDRTTSALLVARTRLFFGEQADTARSRRSHDLLAALFVEGQARGEIDPRLDADQLAELYIAQFMLTASNWLTGWFGSSPQTLTDRLEAALHVFLHGAAAATAASQQAAPDVP